MHKILIPLVLLLFLLAGCGVTDITESDTYNTKQDYSLFAKPIKLEQVQVTGGLQLPNLVKEYWNSKPLNNSRGIKVVYDLYLGRDREGTEDFFAVRSGCGFDIKAISFETKLVRNVSPCHSFDFGTSKMRDWKTAQSDFLISNGKMIYWLEEPYEKRDSYKTKKAWNDHPEIYPRNTLVIIDTKTGSRKDVVIEAPTGNRMKGADFFKFCFSHDLEYFVSYFSSNFNHCFTPFNQGERCDSKNNLVAGKLKDGKVHFIFSGKGSFDEGKNPNLCSVNWTEKNNLVFTFNGVTYLSKNLENDDT